MPDRPDPTPDEVNTANLNAADTTDAAPAQEAAHPLSSGNRPGDTIGPYKLLEMLGEGGFGEVWLAEQKEPIARRVALKLIKAGMDSKAVLARFEQERRALALMDHPNIARVHDAGVTQTGRPYFVMEHVKGAPITDYCDRARLTITQRLELFSKVCDAVQHAHMKGIIHRDLKPSNILVSVGAGGDKDKAGEARPVVIDFGVAKAVAARLTEKTIYTEQGQLIGTPEYMSPEQAEMAETDIDTRTDIYALGVILYELLTGALPFDPKTLRAAGYAAIQKMIREVDPPKPSTKLSGMRSEPGASATGRGGVQPSETVESNRGPLADARGSRVDAIAAARRTDLSSLARELKRELDWIPLKAMRKERTERYRTASELSDDIANYLNHRPLIAGPESAAYRVKKFIRRNRIGVLAGAAVFAALVLGMAGTAWQYTEARRNARLADERAAAAEEARTAEAARAAELRQVADFQAGMLAQVDPTEAGRRLSESVTSRFAAALTTAGVPEADRAMQIETFNDQWRRVNATDAARELIERTILTPAAETIDRRFKDQPVVDAQLRQVLANLYRGLSLYDTARDLQERVVEIRRRELGEDHLETLYSKAVLGLILMSQGRFPEAESTCRAALEGRRRVLGEDHPDTIASIAELGVILERQGKRSEAEPLYHETLERRRRVRGVDHPETLQSVAAMGTLLQSRGKLAEAEPFLREALEQRRRVLGDDHADTLGSLEALGLLYQAQGRFAEAEPYCREALDMKRRILGEEHHGTHITMGNLGFVLHSQGKFAEAEPLHRESLDKKRALLGDDHPSTLVSVSNLGHVLSVQRRFDEAEPYCREALEKRRRILGEEHPETINSMHTMGTLCLLQGRHAEAETHLREALDKRRRVVGPEHPRTLASLGALGTALRAQAKFAETVELLAPIEPQYRAAFTGDNTDRVFMFLLNLGVARAGSGFEPGRFAAAEANLLEAHAGFVRLRAHELERACVDVLVTFYTDWDAHDPGKGHDVRAAEWRARQEALEESATSGEPGG